MAQDDGNKWPKFLISLIAVGSSLAIEAELVKEERLAQKEQRFGDLVLLGISHFVKRSADLEIGKWIANL